ncbi:hypothetical protein ACNKHT_18475 [Shigella flexneri]
MMNEVNLSGLHDASWFAIVTPMSFGMQFRSRFHSDHDCRVNHRVYRVMGMFLALGEIIGRKLSSHDLFAGCVSMA